MSECSISGRGQGHVSNFYIVDLEIFATASRRYTGDIHNTSVVGLFMTPIPAKTIGQTLVQCHSVHWKLVGGERWANAYLKQWPNVQPMLLAQCRGTHAPPMHFQCYFHSLPTNCHWFLNILWSKKHVFHFFAVSTNVNNICNIWPTVQ